MAFCGISKSRVPHVVRIPSAAQPGVIVPRGRGDGVIALDAVIQADPAFGQDYPESPVFVTIEKGRVVHIAGNGFSADRLRLWLESLNSEQSWNGPVHINNGNNPRARFSEISEFERVRGVITFGMGDVSVLSGVLGLADDMEGNLAAPAHWGRRHETAFAAARRQDRLAERDHPIRVTAGRVVVACALPGLRTREDR